MRRFLSPGPQLCGQRRRGAAIVEFAVVLPLLLILLFGMVEFGWLFMIRQTLVNAAREGCRVAVLQTATPDMVAARIREVMEPLGFEEGEVWNFTASDIGDEVQAITVTVPVSEIALTGGFILSENFDLSGTCSMRKEGTSAGDDGGDDA